MIGFQKDPKIRKSTRKIKSMKTRGIEYLKQMCRIWTPTRLNLAALEIKRDPVNTKTD